MGHLLRTLEGPNEIDRLTEAYEVLADAYLKHRSGKSESLENVGCGSRFRTLCSMVLATEDFMHVGELSCKCDLISTDFERPVEVYNNLGQIEVLIAAVTILRKSYLRPQTCAPTQQSTDQDGNAISDLQGVGWRLEAYGGLNCKSNQKLFEDLCTLHQSSHENERLFLAFRHCAWQAAYKSKRLEQNANVQVQGTTKKGRTQYGGHKVNVSANLKLVDEHDSICVVEVTGVVTSQITDG